jgi:hypothetical protein
MPFCALASLVYLNWTKSSGETPQATEVVVYHHHIESHPVLQSPLFPYDLPRPREPAEPTFEPRLEEPILEIGERCYGLVPRFQRPLVDLRVALPERGPRPPRAAAFPVRRERLLTEMSDRERMAVMDWEEGQEKYREQRESDRYYARLCDENEAVRASKAAALPEEEEAARQSHAGEEQPKTADKISSTIATEDGQTSPTRIDETTAKTVDTVGSNTEPQDGQNERKNTKLTINPGIAPYSGGSEAMQGDQPISGNNTQSDALKGTDCNNGDGAAGSYTNATVLAPNAEASPTSSRISFYYPATMKPGTSWTRISKSSPKVRKTDAAMSSLTSLCMQCMCPGALGSPTATTRTGIPRRSTRSTS